MNRALVLGGNGQDGTLITRHLLARGYEVVSLDVEPSPRGEHDGRAFRYVAADLSDRAALAELLLRERPALIFHLAAVHASSGGQYEEHFGAMLTVNVNSVHVVLEHLRRRDRGGRLLYASSSKAFGEPLPDRVDEATPRRSSCLYGVTKNAARDVIGCYRDAHGTLASVMYLFNHESPLRPAGFFIPKLVGCLRRARAGSPSPAIDRTQFHTLDFFCDWGSADEYCDIMVDVLERAPGEDFVLATGRCLNARELARRLFRDHGQELADHVEETHASATTRPRPYVANADKLQRLVGRRPTQSIERVIEEMLAAAR